MKPVKKRRRILSAPEIAVSKEDIEERMIQLETPELTSDGGSVHWDKAPNKMVNRRSQELELKNKKRILEEGTPEMTKAVKRKNDEKIKEIEEYLQQKGIMVPHKAFHMKNDHSSDYRKVVDHLVKVEMNPENVRLMEELKARKRLRDQSDPNSGNISGLREGS